MRKTYGTSYDGFGGKNVVVDEDDALAQTYISLVKLFVENLVLLEGVC
jgi:hypothetical protein